MTIVRSQSSMAMARARYALTVAGLDPETPLERASSVTNEVWLAPAVVIRVNRRPSTRLRREARLAPLLPPEVHYPKVVTYGEGSGFDFLILERNRGEVLSRAWPLLSIAQRRRAARQLAVILQALHRTPYPSAAGVPDQAPQLLGGATSSPCAPLFTALDKARSLPHVESDLVISLIAFLKAHHGVLEPWDRSHFIHGDLTFENVLWDGDEISALIDFEWSRGAPRDLELDVFLRFCAYPFLHVAPDYESTTVAADYEDVPFWIRDDYPAMFDGPHMLDRARIYSIAFDVRELLRHPPDRPRRELSEHHALNRLARTVDHRSHLDRFANPDLHL